jgi:hypothetical protein
MLLINQLALGTDVAGSAHQFNFSRRLDASQLVNIRPAVEIRQLELLRASESTTGKGINKSNQI